MDSGLSLEGRAAQRTAAAWFGQRDSRLNDNGRLVCAAQIHGLGDMQIFAIGRGLNNHAAAADTD